MSKKLPTRLASEPIVEVVSEVRFDAAGDAAVNLLPGILHAQLGPFDQQGRTFPVPFPAEMLAADPVRAALSPTWKQAFAVLSAHLHPDESDATG